MAQDSKSIAYRARWLGASYVCVHVAMEDGPNVDWWITQFMWAERTQLMKIIKTQFKYLAKRMHDADAMTKLYCTDLLNDYMRRVKFGV